jgi:hypothetical protein
MLVDLGLITRTGGDSNDRAGTFPWQLPDATRELAARIEQLAVGPQHTDEFLDREFVKVIAPALGLNLRPARGATEALLWFTRSYEIVRREIGFTPGRTVAQLGSLLAAEHGVALEVREIYDQIYAVPSGPYASHFQFSGGSRFDQEFMIRVSPDLTTRLLDDLRTDTPDNGGEE